VSECRRWCLDVVTEWSVVVLAVPVRVVGEIEHQIVCVLGESRHVERLVDVAAHAPVLSLSCRPVLW
jgi:hypothetical protein